MSRKTHIALLRGINVGGKVLKMADLKAAVSKLDLGEVETYLQSGNMIFRGEAAESGAIAGRISRAISDHAGMDVTVIVRTAEEWKHVVGNNPYPQAAEFPKSVHAFILERAPDPARLDALAAKEAGREEWRLIDGAIYLHTPDGLGKSVLGNCIERTLKVPMTARNWNTVLALQKVAAGL